MRPGRNAVLMRTATAVAASVAVLAVAAPGWGLSLSDLLAESPAPWPGQLLRLAQGPATAGAWSAPAWGDVTADGRPDLVLGSAFGDVLVYPGRADGTLGPPSPLLQPQLPGQPLALRPAIPCLATAANSTSNPDLWLLLDGHLVVYRAEPGGFAPGRELRSEQGQSLAEQLSAAGIAGDLVGFAVLPGEEAVLLATGEGLVWRLSVKKGLSLGRLEPQTAAGRSLRFPEACHLAVGDVDGDGGLDLIAAGEQCLYLCHFIGANLARPLLLAEQLTTPEGLPTRGLAPAVAGPGELLLGLAWGPVMRAEVEAGRAKITGWATALRAPLDVGLDAAPRACDWDGDGREDLVAGSADGHVRVFLQRSDGLYEPGALVQDAQGPLTAPGKTFRPCFPYLADLDGDRDLDLLLGEGGGQVHQWRNDGAFVALGPVKVAGQPLFGPGVAVPVALDWDRDGDMDLFVGAQPPPRDWTGAPGPDHYAAPVSFLENPGHRSAPLAFDKRVAVDLLVQHGDVHGDAVLLEPWQVLARPFSSVGQKVLLFGRAGLFAFAVATVPPAYPRLVLDTAHAPVRPLQSSEDVWAVARTTRPGQVLVGLGPYGFICTADLSASLSA
ncbi:MAG: VCBS repeat-containing protein, partial [Armatimonadetes bacterium]|nr:VCBS repeat-containing protein [Armatimonadota bacterium]